MNISFRIAESSDVEEIIKLCNECFEENTDIDFAKEIFEKTKDDKNQIYLVGEVNDEIIAHTKITIIPTMFGEMQTYSVLNHVCVKKEYRRHNVATLMLQECERISKENGCVSIVLWSMNYRQAAQSCYSKYGFLAKDAKFYSKNLYKEKNYENK